MTRTLSPWTHRFPRLSDFEREFPRWMNEVFGPETGLRDFERVGAWWQQLKAVVPRVGGRRCSRPALILARQGHRRAGDDCPTLVRKRALQGSACRGLRVHVAA